MMPITWNNVADRLKMCYTAKLHPQMRLAAFFHAMSSILIFTVYCPLLKKAAISATERDLSFNEVSRAETWINTILENQRLENFQNRKLIKNLT